MKEHKVGEQFTLPAVTLEVVAQFSCDGCYFNGGDVCRSGLCEDCSNKLREDRTSVIFKEVPPTIEDTANNMVAAAVGNVDFAYIIAHRTIEGEISIKTIGKPENISMLKERLLKILEEGK